MNDDLFLRYGRAIFEIERWSRERDDVFLALREECRLFPAHGDRATGPLVKRSYAAAHGDVVRGGRYFGILKEVADQLGIRPTSVSRVWHNKRRSARISTAIAEAIARRDAELAAKQVSV